MVHCNDDAACGCCGREVHSARLGELMNMDGLIGTIVREGIEIMFRFQVVSRVGNQKRTEIVPSILEDKEECDLGNRSLPTR